MKAIVCGAVLGLVWLLFGSPLVTIAAVLPAHVLRDLAGGGNLSLGDLLARPYVRRSRRWTA